MATRQEFVVRVVGAKILDGWTQFFPTTRPIGNGIVESTNVQEYEILWDYSHPTANTPEPTPTGVYIETHSTVPEPIGTDFVTPKTWFPDLEELAEDPYSEGRGPQ
jgi:hypothetical protein